MRTALLGLVLFGLRAAYGQAGTVDPTFNTQTNAPDSVNALVLQPDGKVIIAGWFTTVQGVPRKGVARLLPSGALDPTFDPGSGANGIVTNLLLQPDGRILLLGAFTSYNGIPRARLARVMSNGTLDLTFDPGTGPLGNYSVPFLDWVLQPDGRVLITGDIISMNGIAVPRLVRLMPTGAVDMSFNQYVGTGPNSAPLCIALQADGRILIGGYFLSVSGVPCRGLARLWGYGGVESQSTFDQSIGFQIPNAPYGEVYDICVQPDGMIVVVGGFETYRGSNANDLVRINPNGGALLMGWSSSAPGYLTSCAVQTDGKILRMDNQGVLQRQLPSGAWDPTFTLYQASSFSLDAAVVQPDGKLLVLRPLKRLKGDATGALPVSVKALLGGPFDQATSKMSDGLRVAGLIPLAQPYTFGQVSGGTEQRPPWVTSVSGDNAVVDWLMVELRDTPMHVLMTRNGLLQRDGDVVGTDGSSPLYFPVPVGSYYVSIKHRNHLGVMTAAPVALNLTTSLIDFTNPATATYGTNAQNQIGPKMLLWAGHTNWDESIKYTGSANDRDVLLFAVGSTTPNNSVINVYDRSDTNLDGVIKYTGTANDRDIILTNVGSTTPNNTRTQQLP